MYNNKIKFNPTKLPKESIKLRTRVKLLTDDNKVECLNSTTNIIIKPVNYIIGR